MSSPSVTPQKARNGLPSPSPRAIDRERTRGGSSTAVPAPAESPTAVRTSTRPTTPRQHAVKSSTTAFRPDPVAGPSSPSSRQGRNDGYATPSRPVQACAKCSQPMTGQFVRALGLVFHLNCFLCGANESLHDLVTSYESCVVQDCDKVVAAKFFPIDGPDGKQLVLCETDYFRRLGLLCAACGNALRGSYITALDKKFHTEHFTCSVCTTVFGPQDSYYEHQGSVYCHFHYSCRFAVKCTGCNIAILKQFVEINRNNQDEHWHPECYMIHKVISQACSLYHAETSAQFWNTKLVSAQSSSVDTTGGDHRDGVLSPEAEWRLQETQETPDSLREKQRQIEEQVYRIWTVLSTFEESSAACISEMLRQVSCGHYLDGVEMAEKFVLHVETLFAGIDDLVMHCRAVQAKDFSHVREARMLCKKIVSFFSLLSQSQEAGSRKMGITQELLSLVTGLAHYLKILIRIALTSALRLDREYARKAALTQFLHRLDRLSRDPNATKPASSAIAIPASPPDASPTSNRPDGKRSKPFGYRSLQRALGTSIGKGEAVTDLCESCRATIEGECARFGTSRRWHLGCLRCSKCQRSAIGRDSNGVNGVDPAAAPVALQDFRLMDPSQSLSASRQSARVMCRSCSSEGVSGFDFVSRLEQYAFLLCVALNKLYTLLRQRGAVQASASDEDLSSPLTDDKPLHDAYRDSADVKRMKSVNLDRKTSTTAHVAKRSIVVESPAGRQAQLGEGGKQENIPLSPNATTIPPQQYRERLPNEVPATAKATAQPFAPVRPGLDRALTAVRVIEDQNGLVSPREELAQHPLGDHRIQNEDGITLADLPQVMEVEQAREQRRPVLRQTQVTLLSELSALEYVIVRHVAALILAAENSPIRDLLPSDEIAELLDARKNSNFWGKIFKGNTDRKASKKKGVFGIPLESMVERSGADSMLGAGAAPVRIPAFVDDVLSAMKQMDMSVEGVFRKNGNIRRLKELSDALDRDLGGVNLVDDNPVQLAALLKKFLRELPDPLMTFKLHNLFVATQRIESIDERLRMLHLVSCLLPKTHRDTMEVIFVFLKWVASFSHVDEETGSKMDLNNLATVICPNILYAKGKDPTKDESFLAIRAVLEVLEYQDILWQVPEEMAAVLDDQDLFINPEALTSKAILRRCQEYASRIAAERHRRAPLDPSDSPTRSHRGAVQPHHPHIESGLPSLPSSTTFPSTPPAAPRPSSSNGFVGSQ